MADSDTPRTRQHEIGDFGERFVAYMLPSSWVVHSYKGSEDYGIDLHVEIFSNGKPSGLEFGAQVKTSERVRSSPSIPIVTVSRNNLLYIVSKPYPCMLILVSGLERRARFAWFGDMFSAREIITSLQGPKRTKLRARLQPSYDLQDAAPAIERYLSEVKHTLFSWLKEESHRQSIIDIYFDLHAALDALIECVAVIHNNERTADEVSHKMTFTVTLSVMAYRALYELTQDSTIASLGPVGLTILAIRKHLRRLISRIIPDPYLSQLEKSQESVSIVPGVTESFWPTVPGLACLLRDALRTIGRMMAPWRDFTLQMSGLASTVIDYPYAQVNPTVEDRAVAARVAATNNCGAIKRHP